MTHGCQWLQEIPVRHVYPSRDCHDNETGLFHKYTDDGDSSIKSFVRTDRQQLPLIEGKGREGLPRHHGLR